MDVVGARLKRRCSGCGACSWREFTLDRGQGSEPVVAVYVPTNHLYLGDVVVVPRSAAQYPDLTVEEGVRIVLTGGMALPAHVRAAGGAREGPHAAV